VQVIHLCWEDSWPPRLGGVAALRVLVEVLPPLWLQQWAVHTVRALLILAKQLPPHALSELEDVESTLKVSTGAMQ